MPPLPVTPYGSSSASAFFFLDAVASGLALFLLTAQALLQRFFQSGEN
jgi:hypothetical protein